MLTICGVLPMTIVTASVSPRARRDREMTAPNKPFFDNSNTAMRGRFPPGGAKRVRGFRAANPATLRKISRETDVDDRQNHDGYDDSPANMHGP